MSGFVSFQSDAAIIWKYLSGISGTTAFDIGANGGLVAASLAERFESVIAVEPCAESFVHLSETAPENVRPLNIALSATTGTVTLRETSLTGRLGELFTDDTLPWGAHVGYREVGAMTLDELTEDYGPADFIKIDTEGHELEIVKGGPNTFLANPRFIIEVHADWKGVEIKKSLDALGVTYEQHHHENYRLSSPNRVNHYWLVSEGMG